jgi:hypothetical protein
MRLQRFVPWCFVLTVILCVGHEQIARAAEEVYSDPNPKKLPIDAIIQGEYLGEEQTADGPKKYGVHVIAEGGGKFLARMYHGGLPGEGAEAKPFDEFPGQVEGDLGVFKCKMGDVTVKNAVMSIEDAKTHDLIVKMPRELRESKTLGMKPPKNAVVLLDSTDKDFAAATIENWVAVKAGEEPKLSDEMLCPGVNSKLKFQDCILHVEFMTPFMPKARGQARGNSGVYLQGRYEVQVLDSFGLDSKDNDCGAIYTVKAPSVNMCYPPLRWQTYDIKYTAAKYDGAGKKTANAKITIVHNGVRIHTDVEIPHATTSHITEEGPEPGCLHLQDHGTPVRFRNIWIRVDDKQAAGNAKPAGDAKQADDAKPAEGDAKPQGDAKPADESPK